jgi:hypothetical protein
MGFRALFLIIAFACFSAPVLADDDLDRRLELAREMQALNPVKDQVVAAVQKYVSNLPEEEQAAAQIKILDILNFKAIEKTSIDAYAEVFTVEELEAMIAYYGNPAGRSASQKSNEYMGKVYPEIVRLLDTALLRAKIEGDAP